MVPRLVRVFVSHTSDMAVHPGGRSFVQAALDAVARAELVPIDMRYFTARDDKPADHCRQRVRDCDVYVAIVGFRYGSIVGGESVSYTELEFDEAGAAAIPRLVFLLDETAHDVAAADPDQAAVEGFRRRLRNAGLLVRTFTTDAGLELEVYDALRDTVDPRRPLPPRELPPDVTAFTGRTVELSMLDGLVARQSAAVVISAVSGTAGVGKTALALRWAHRVADRFPDGQLYVDLRGYDPDQPLSAGEALEALLRALGVDGADIPDDVATRAGRYRTLVAGRRMLVVLDNASSVEQVRLLLPGSLTCVAVVTSRDSLPALVARYGARRVELDLLPVHEAVALLRALVGERVDADPDAAAALAEQCARLPLALRVAAELALARPAVSLRRLVDELAEQRLELLDAGGDPRTAVRSVFSWSHRHLTPAAARAFALLGAHPGPDIDGYAAAALLSLPVGEAREILALLARAHLVQVNEGRYGMHDLLRAYALEQAAPRDALTRLLDHYLATATAAVDVVYPADRRRRSRIAVPPAPVAPVADQEAAQAWLDGERVALVAACAHAAVHDWPDHAVRLASVLFRYLDASGHYSDALTVHTHARQAARRLGDRAAEADAVTHLGAGHWRRGRYEEAAALYPEALDLYHELGDRIGEARARGSIGSVHFQQGRYAQAASHQELALALFREAGDRPGQARAQRPQPRVRTAGPVRRGHRS